MGGGTVPCLERRLFLVRIFAVQCCLAQFKLYKENQRQTDGRGLIGDDMRPLFLRPQVTHSSLPYACVAQLTLQINSIKSPSGIKWNWVFFSLYPFGFIIIQLCMHSYFGERAILVSSYKPTFKTVLSFCL